MIDNRLFRVGDLVMCIDSVSIFDGREGVVINSAQLNEGEPPFLNNEVYFPGLGFSLISDDELDAVIE